MPNSTLNILGFSGSLRQGSWNSGLLRAAREVLPTDMTLEIYDLTMLPLYNADLHAQIAAGAVPSVIPSFQGRVAAADALLIATPEYTYSISGVLKNAIDWITYPPENAPTNNKPLAIMGAGGRMGTSQAQYHLRQMAVYANMHPLNKPEVQVVGEGKFDEAGNLKDDGVRQEIRALLAALRVWTLRLRA